MSETGATKSLRDVAERFHGRSFSTRLYIFLRHRVLPVERIAELIPPGGLVLDLCCGYGTLTMLLALRDSRRTVLGVDLDRERIAVASDVARDIPNVRFEPADILTFTPPRCDAALLIDSLHYFSPALQTKILRALRSGLKDGGTLVCREVVRSRSLRFFWNWLHEQVMVGLSFTRSNQERMSFDSLEALKDRFRLAGFDVTHVEGPTGWHPYADHIIVARAA